MNISTRKNYRSGAIGALMDEYERAAGEMKYLVERIPETDFEQIVDDRTNDDDCRSVQTIVSHVITSGYGYADYIREQFSLASNRPAPQLFSCREFPAKLDLMIEYTTQTLAGRWEMSHEEITKVIIKTRRGTTYHLEQMLQHAIVHILRHRRQIEKFIVQGLITLPNTTYEAT